MASLAQGDVEEMKANFGDDMSAALAKEVAADISFSGAVSPPPPASPAAAATPSPVPSPQPSSSSSAPSSPQAALTDDQILQVLDAFFDEEASATTKLLIDSKNFVARDREKKMLAVLQACADDPAKGWAVLSSAVVAATTAGAASGSASMTSAAAAAADDASSPASSSSSSSSSSSASSSTSASSTSTASSSNSASPNATSSSPTFLIASHTTIPSVLSSSTSTAAGKLKSRAAALVELWRGGYVARRLAHEVHMSEKLLHELTSNDGWTSVKKSDKTHTYYRKETGMKSHSFKVTGEIEQGIFDILSVVYEGDLFPRWFPFVSTSTELMVVSRFHKVMHMALKAVFPFAKRDFTLGTARHGTRAGARQGVARRGMRVLRRAPCGPFECERSGAGLSARGCARRTSRQMRAPLDVRVIFLVGWLFQEETFGAPSQLRMFHPVRF